MKTQLPQSISTVEEAKAFLKALYDNDEYYHPEDDPHDVGDRINGEWIPLFTTEEADKVEILMDQISAMKEIDACGYILDLDLNIKW